MWEQRQPAKGSRKREDFKILSMKKFFFKAEIGPGQHEQLSSWKALGEG